MEEFINDIYDLVKDYRSDEHVRFRMSEQRIEQWVNQFDENDRIFLLSELKNILEKHYWSKDKVKQFIKDAVVTISQDLGYSNPQEFLRDCVFLDLQPEGKSQKKMLELLTEILRDEFSFDSSDCGTNQEKHFIYVDDILCTGKTLFDDIQGWCKDEYTNGETNLQALKTSKISLIFAYIFIHKSNYFKKLAQFGYMDKSLKSNCQMFRAVEIDNTNNLRAGLELIFPLESEDELIMDYRDAIIEQVDEYNTGKKYNKAAEYFYRKTGMPKNESLFTSPENRNRFENIMLKKGMEILNSADVNIPNMRALGYSLPSQKNFGFGTLCFTWRNVPNNTPLTFWYDGGGNYPLFVVNRGQKTWGL